MTVKSLLVIPAVAALLSTCALADTPMKPMHHAMKPHAMMSMKGHSMVHSHVIVPHHRKHHPLVVTHSIHPLVVTHSIHPLVKAHAKMHGHSTMKPMKHM